jgi:acyl carrier protein
MIEIKEIRQSIKQYISKNAFVPVEEIEDETLIFEEGVFDSMGFLSLINHIENEYKIIAEDAELIEYNFESVEAIGNFIGRKLA